MQDGGFLANKLTNDILFMITSENLPLSIVDSKGFKRLMNRAAPLYTVPSRRTITRLIDAKYDFLKDSFKEDLKLSSTFTLTCDIWTDVSNQSYLGVTIHYLRHELVLSNATIGVFPLMQNHTANYVRETLISVIESFGIDVESIIAVVTDSAANMKKAITDGFGSAKHLPCIAHIVSHLVPDAIKLSPRIGEIIAKVKSIVSVTKRSVVASDELKRLQIRDGKTDSTALKLKQDVPTRWNSTYYMIERFLELKDYIYPVLLTCRTAPTALSREEISILEDTVRLLGPIEFVTTEISGDSYPTSSMVIPLIHCMEATIKNCIPITVEGKAFKDSILSEVQRRDVLKKLNHIRYLQCQLFWTRDINACISSHQKMLPMPYHTLTVNLVDSCTPFTPSVDEPGGVNLELQQYLNQPPILRNQDPFKHWQTLKPAYPTLFTVAMRYLSVVATSVPSERMFSKAGIVKSDLRSRLSGKRLNSLLFLGSLSEESWGQD
ncbi:E3 SUMO-protein ligase ZBED1 [Temnothorax longispinosus]|uniref:E3 SUMO-protein ligase ZBED1 n=1 Tax=Temnothorax longispinosus TaxID=300112 RepID=UPI003A99A39A